MIDPTYSGEIAYIYAFDIAYELLRCRSTVTGGGASDKIAFAIQLAK